MTQRHISLPRWLVATLAGLLSAAVSTAVIYFGTGLEFGLSAFVGGGLGLVIALLVARWLTAASFVMSLLEVTVSAVAALVSILAAVVGALS
jgi:hypothetical protein